MKIKLPTFAEQGLGAAPYRFIGIKAAFAVARERDAALIQCDHCGTIIQRCCEFEAAGGERFIVGSDCALKAMVAEPGNEAPISALKSALAKEVHAKAAAKKEAARLEWIAMKARIAEHAEAIARLPHSKGWAGHSRLSEIEWFFSNAGRDRAMSEGRSALNEIGVQF